MLTRFEAHNFTSLESLKLVLRPFTVLVGPNGAGKTNIIKSVELLGDLLYRGSTDPILETGWESIARRRGRTRNVMTLAARAVIPADVVRSIARTEDRRPVGVTLGLTLGWSSKTDEIGVKAETLTLWRGRNHLSVSLRRGGEPEIQLGNDPALWELMTPFGARVRTRKVAEGSQNDAADVESVLRDQLATTNRRADRGSRFLRLLALNRYYYTPWFDYIVAACRVQRLRLDASALRGEAVGERSARSQLGPAGEGLADAVARLRGRGSRPERAFLPVLHALQAVFPRIEDVVPVRYLPGRLALTFKEKGISGRLGHGNVSDGTIHTLALLMALQDPGEGTVGPRLLAVEEPENAIHPWAIRTVMDRAQRSRRQVVMTTHSPIVVDEVRDPRSLYIVSYDAEHGTSATPAPRVEENLTEVLRESGLKLGDIWISGSLGGVPQT